MYIVNSRGVMKFVLTVGNCDDKVVALRVKLNGDENVVLVVVGGVERKLLKLLIVVVL